MKLSGTRERNPGTEILFWQRWREKKRPEKKVGEFVNQALKLLVSFL